MRSRERRVQRRSCRVDARLRDAQLVGRIVTCTLELGCVTPTWWRWTTSLALAMRLREAVLR